jgi:hypothetical protein
MQRLTGPRIKAGNRHYCRRSGLDDETLAKGRRLIERALSRSRYLTRTALGDVLAKAGIEGGGQRLAYLVMDAELELLVCSGPLQGKQFSYALVDQHVPQGDAYSGDEALAELARRYFTSHGPATVHDFSWWSGLTVAQCRRGVDAVGSGLRPRIVDGNTYWASPTPTRTVTITSPAVHLLPNYDEYLNALRDRSLALDPRGPVPTLAMFVGFPHQLVIDGILRGAWRRVTARAGTNIVVRPFRPLSKKETTALAAAVERFGRFLNAPTTLTLA